MDYCAREESYTTNLLDEYATFSDFGWKRLVYDRILDLEKALKQRDEERIAADKLRTKVEQLKTYIDVLERQLSLASKVISTMNAEFPVYTEKKEDDV
jgi:hypothetical protein